MHDYLLSLFLGVVEGLTEFLPVSSTAHLRISEALLHIHLDDPFWKMYSIVIQLGAILCLPIYFRARIARFLSTFPGGERADRTTLTHPLSLVMIAFVCTAIPSLLLTKLIGKHLESLTVMGVSLLVGGVVMWIVDAYFGSPRTVGRHMTERMEDVSLVQAIWMASARWRRRYFRAPRAPCPPSPPDRWPACPAPPLWSFPFSIDAHHDRRHRL